MADGKIQIQSTDNRIYTVTPEVGASGNVALTLPKEGGMLTVDAEVVHKTGDETKTGTMTFMDNVGVGTTPTEVLDIKKSANGSTAKVRLENTGGGGSTDYAEFSTYYNYATPQETVFGQRNNAWGWAGTKTNHPFYLMVNGALRLDLDTSGNVKVMNGSGLGYGTGSGGTVTQLTGKSITVTLHKPCGVITMHNASLSAGSAVSFAVLCSPVTPTDTVVVGFNANIVGVHNNYAIQSVTAGNSNFIVNIKNISGGALAEAVQLNFAIIKGATA